ncbi:MAG: PKD domain-containing protein [bacterium]|nr:PKD domain-containing protein [bacterium]
MKRWEKISGLFSLLCVALFSQSQPIANFTANQLQGCAPHLVQFTSTSTGSPTSYLWQFGNGNTSTLQNPSASYVMAGKFTVKLTVTNAIGSNTKTNIEYITVYALPNVAFGALVKSGCTPLSISFIDSSTLVQSTLQSWAWDFGNGNIATQKNPTNLFSVAGKYPISLLVTDANGCKKSLIKNNYIWAQTPPVVNFTANNNFGCDLPFKPQFTPIINPVDSYSYFWDFGNATNSSMRSPIATYNNKGTYGVQLKMVTAAQCTVSIVKPAFIKIADIVPDFQISGTPDLCAPGNLFLLNTTNFDTFGIQYEWFINGVLVTSFKNATLKNLAAGTYSVQLKVKVGTCDVSASKNAFFTVLPSPVSRFSANKTSFCKVPVSVQFTDSSSNALSYFWNFGNTLTSAQKDPNTTYTQFGDYDVTLITSHLNGCRDTLKMASYIKVRNAVIKIVSNPKMGCFPLIVSFSVLDTNVPPFNNFAWTFGKAGASSTLKSPNYTYTDTGTYIVTLTAINVEGCISIQKDTVKAGMLVLPNFTSPKTTYCFNEQPVSFSVTTNPNIGNLGYSWTYSDTLVSGSGSSNLLYFKDTGTFDISLYVNHNGCISAVTKIKYITILGPIAKFIFALNACTNSFASFSNISKGGNKFIWNFGDGYSSKLFSPTHDYDSSGNYTVSLLAIDTLTGCSSFYSRQINVKKDIRPSFTIAKAKGCMPLTTLITNTTATMTDIVKVEFNIGGNDLVGNVVSALLYNPGKYTVTLTLTDSKGCKYSLTKVDSIQVFGANINFASTPDFGCAPMLMLVYDSSKTELPITRRVWTWGNGDSTVYTNNDSMQSRYLFTSAPAYQNGGFFLKLSLIDSFGCKFSLSRKIYISKPIPNFTIKQTKTCLKDTFTFSPSADDLIGLTPISYQWKMDNQISNTRIAKLVYRGDTLLPITLIATDAYGCKDSTTKMIKVLTGPAKVDFDANPKRINCPGPPIYFFDKSKIGSTPITTWDWQFGDGGQSNLQNPIRIYLLPGTYSVQLTVTDSLGCKSLMAIPDMLIIGGPSGSYSLTPNLGCSPLLVTLLSFGQNVIKYEWDFGDGVIDTTANTKHLYTRAGWYIPSLTLTDSAGCKIGLPRIDSIQVLDNPKVDFSVSKFKNCLGSDLTITGSVLPVNNVKSYYWNVDEQVYNSLGPHVVSCNRIGNIPVLFEVTDHLGCKGFKQDSIAFQVFKDSIPPAKPFAISASVANDEEVSFKFLKSLEPDLDHYQIAYNYVGSVPSQIRHVYNLQDTLQSFLNLNTLRYNYSYRLTSVDACKNVSLADEVHTTIELKATGVENAVDLAWTPYIGWDSVQFYTIYKLDEQTKNFRKIGQVRGKELVFTDTQIYCHKVHYYKVKGEFGSIESTSDTAAAIPIFKAFTPSTRALRATVAGNTNVLIQWFKRQYYYPFSYVLKRTSADPRAPIKTIVKSSADSFYVDLDVDVERYSYSYVVYLRDDCGGLSEPSNKAKTILLSVNVEKNDKLIEDPDISWNAYENWGSGVERYEVYFYNDSFGEKELITTRFAQDTLATKHDYINFNQDDYCYQVVAYQKDSNWVESWSNIACMSTEPRLYAPNAFTNNGDKLNDGFLLTGVFVKSFNLQIYDRWGNRLFETNDMNKAWDGTYNGELVQPDVYVYIATGYGRKGKYKTLKGNVTLLR